MTRTMTRRAATAIGPWRIHDPLMVATFVMTPVCCQDATAS
jgi:hypothetical protein